MATKTITLELDAYEKLRRAKRGSESFSAVVRRAHFEPEGSTGSAILEDTEKAYKTGKGVTKNTLDYWDQAGAEDAVSPRISVSEWE